MIIKIRENFSWPIYEKPYFSSSKSLTPFKFLRRFNKNELVHVTFVRDSRDGFVIIKIKPEEYLLSVPVKKILVSKWDLDLEHLNALQLTKINPSSSSARLVFGNQS